MAAKAQSTEHHNPNRITASDLEIFYSTTPRPDGLVQIDLTVAGIKGVEVDQISQVDGTTTLFHSSLAPSSKSSVGSPNLSHLTLICEKEVDQKGVMLSLHEFNNSDKGLRMIIPADVQEQNVHISAQFSQLTTPRADRTGSGVNANMLPVGAGDCPDGMYSITYSSTRCGHMAVCCSGPGASIDGVSCSIRCN
jgi:hypothetical protein